MCFRPNQGWNVSPPDQDRPRNLLLRSLGPADFARLAARLEPVPLPRREVLIEPNAAIAHVWFPDSGLGSIVATTPEGHSSEVGIFGRDGLAGAPLLLGADRSRQLVVIQEEGAGWRCTTEAFLAAIAESRSLHMSLLR